MQKQWDIGQQYQIKIKGYKNIFLPLGKENITITKKSTEWDIDDVRLCISVSYLLKRWLKKLKAQSTCRISPNSFCRLSADFQLMLAWRSAVITTWFSSGIQPMTAQLGNVDCGLVSIKKPSQELLDLHFLHFIFQRWMRKFGEYEQQRQQ